MKSYSKGASAWSVSLPLFTALVVGFLGFSGEGRAQGEVKACNYNLAPSTFSGRVEFESPSPSSVSIFTKQLSPQYSFVIEAPTKPADLALLYPKNPVSSQSDLSLLVSNKAAKTSMVSSSRQNAAPAATLGSVAAANAPYVILVGHNENGIFRFLDGNDIRIGDIFGSINGAGNNTKVPIVISCHSRKFTAAAAGGGGGIGGDDDLTWSQSFCIAQRIKSLLDERIAAGLTISPAELQKAYNVNEKLRCNAKAKLFFVAACGAIAASYAIIVHRDKEARDNREPSTQPSANTLKLPKGSPGKASGSH